VIRLAGEVGGNVIILVFLERVVAQIAPQNGRHAEFVGFLKRLGDFDDLTARMIGTEVNRRADGGRTEVIRLFHRAEFDLIKFVRIAEKLVVVDLDDERNLVGILPCDRRQNAERRGDGVATAFDSELDDVLAVEVHRILREARATRMFNALIDRQNRQIARAARRPWLKS